MSRRLLRTSSLLLASLSSIAAIPGPCQYDPHDDLCAGADCSEGEGEGEPAEGEGEGEPAEGEGEGEPAEGEGEPAEGEGEGEPLVCVPGELLISTLANDVVVGSAPTLRRFLTAAAVIEDNVRTVRTRSFLTDGLPTSEAVVFMSDEPVGQHSLDVVAIGFNPASRGFAILFLVSRTSIPANDAYLLETDELGEALGAPIPLALTEGEDRITDGVVVAVDDGWSIVVSVDESEDGIGNGTSLRRVAVDGTGIAGPMRVLASLGAGGPMIVEGNTLWSQLRPAGATSEIRIGTYDFGSDTFDDEVVRLQSPAQLMVAVPLPFTATPRLVLGTTTDASMLLCEGIVCATQTALGPRPFSTRTLKVARLDDARFVFVGMDRDRSLFRYEVDREGMVPDALVTGPTADGNYFLGVATLPGAVFIAERTPGSSFAITARLTCDPPTQR